MDDPILTRPHPSVANSGLTARPTSPHARTTLATLECKASEGRVVVFVGNPDGAAQGLANGQAFGIELGESSTFQVRLVAEDELPSVADVLHSAFAFPIDVSGPVHLGTAVGSSQGSWTVDEGPYWGALYEVFPDCEESIGAQYVLVLARQDTLPSPRWKAMPHLTDAVRTPDGADFPEALALPGDAMDDAPMPDLRSLFAGVDRKARGTSEPAPAPTTSDASSDANKSPDAVASRLFAAIAGLDEDEDADLGQDEDDLGDGDEPTAAQQRDPFYNFIKTLVAEEQLALVEGASVRKLAERLELALERDPMMFQRPGDWFFEQQDVDELFASDEELKQGIHNAFNR